jgi:transposase
VGGTVPRTHGSTTTLVAALSLEGITAAMTVEGAMNRAAVDVVVDQILAPSVQAGQVVIWDTRTGHTSDDARARIAARGCQLLWLPPSSPDLTPIEHAFSTLKAALRRAQARTRDALDAAFTAGLATITTADARGWFTHCGYPIPSLLI